MAQDNRTEKQKLDYRLKKYLKEHESKKSPSRLVKANRLLESVGLNLLMLSTQNKNVALALKLLLDSKDKFLQFRFKAERDVFYRTINEGIVGALKALPSKKVVPVLQKILDVNGKLFQKNPKPIDRLQSVNSALVGDKKSIFDKEYYIDPALQNKISDSQSLHDSAKAAVYRSKIIRTILGIGTQEDVNLIQDRIKNINANQKLKAMQSKVMTPITPLQTIRKTAEPMKIYTATYVSKAAFDTSDKVKAKTPSKGRPKR